MLIQPCLADHSTEKVLTVLARKRDINRILMPHRMDTLTNEKTLLLVSRSAGFERHDSSSSTPIGEELIRDTSDNLDAILEDDYRADDSSLAPQVGAHGSYKFSMHVLILPSICVLKKQTKGGLPPDKLQQWVTPPDPLTAHEAGYLEKVKSTEERVV